jgi:hypothetical protein
MITSKDTYDDLVEAWKNSVRKQLIEEHIEVTFSGKGKVKKGMSSASMKVNRILDKMVKRNESKK